VILRELIAFSDQGADAFFGEPEFDTKDLMRTASDGKGLVTCLELPAVQDRPALFSTFLMWLLADLFHDLPEVGDVDKPKLVFFFDEAHLLFDGASKALLAQIEQTVRLIRSKGVGVFFVTQSPKDVPPDVLGQLGHRVQHALRAFTEDDDTALRAAARTFPKTSFYDIEETLTTLGIGEAFVSTLATNGVPTQPFAVRMVPPASRMGPLTDAELQQRISTSVQVKKYAEDIDRQSAREMLEDRAAPAAAPPQAAPPPPPPPGQYPYDYQRQQAEAASGPPPQYQYQRQAQEQPKGRGRAPREEPGMLEKVLKSGVARSVATQVTRGLMGALLGTPSRRRRRGGLW
jgi:hypothetical protein